MEEEEEEEEEKEEEEQTVTGEEEKNSANNPDCKGRQDSAGVETIQNSLPPGPMEQLLF